LQVRRSSGSQRFFEIVFRARTLLEFVHLGIVNGVPA
jgi:hypothetical protein